MRLPVKLGLIRRKERWYLTRRGGVLLCAVLLICSVSALRKADGFLSLTCRLQTETLVVEGWLPDYALAAALQEFTNGHYTLLITVGGPLPKGSFLSEYKTSAEVAAATLRKMGAEPESVVAVSAPKTAKDRTYASALAVKEWMTASHSALRAANVFSLGPHARRSRLIFQKAFGDEALVGVVSSLNEEYDQRYWWTTSEGVRTVLGEVIAYLYSRFFFHPCARVES